MRIFCRWNDGDVVHLNNKAMVVLRRHGKPMRGFIRQGGKRKLAMEFVAKTSVLAEILDGDGS